MSNIVDAELGLARFHVLNFIDAPSKKAKSCSFFAVLDQNIQ